MMIRKIVLSLVCFLPVNFLFAAEANQNLWTTGKVYAVLTVLLTIFAGIIIFLIILERKMSKLEKKYSDKI